MNKPLINPTDRHFIERTKQARAVSITINPGHSDMLHRDLAFDRKLYHDIAIAIQDYYVRNARESQR